MREIKFRAWDKKSKKMREVDVISFHNKRGWFDGDDSRLPKVVTVWGYALIEQKDCILHREPEKGEVILMQFTGLKDKNGKEEYGCDIIQTDGVDGKLLWQIVWNEEEACFDFEGIGHTYSCIHNEIYDKGEIKGNIYKNPELLKTSGATKK